MTKREYQESNIVPLSVDPLNMLMLYSGFSNNEEFADEFRIEII